MQTPPRLFPLWPLLPVNGIDQAIELVDLLPPVVSRVLLVIPFRLADTLLQMLPQGVRAGRGAVLKEPNGDSALERSVAAVAPVVVPDRSQAFSERRSHQRGSRRACGRPLARHRRRYLWDANDVRARPHYPRSIAATSEGVACAFANDRLRYIVRLHRAEHGGIDRDLSQRFVARSTDTLGEPTL